MKILFLCRLFYPHVGGVEKHVMEIGKRMVKEGHRVTVITENTFGSMNVSRAGELKNGIKVYRIPVGESDRGKKFRVWGEMWKLRRLILEADVVHCHDVFFWYLPFRFLYPRKPIYTTFHGYESYPIRNNAILMRKISEKLSWGNICIGDFIEKWYGTKPTLVSYGAVSSNSKPHPDPLLLGEGDIKVKKESALFVGRLDGQTGVVTYVEAGEIVKKKYPGFELVVVGDGEDREKIEKRVKVLGWQADAQKYLLKYHFAFVSRYLAILEAFAARKLVFAVYDNPVKEDYLRMAPFAKWIVIEKNPEALAEKVEYYLKHPKEEQELIEKAYDWVKDQTWENMVQRYLKLWQIGNSW